MHIPSAEGDAYPSRLPDIAHEGPINIMAWRLLQHLQELMRWVGDAVVIVKACVNPEQNLRGQLGIDQRHVKVAGMGDIQIFNKCLEFVDWRTLALPARGVSYWQTDLT